jgi:hypothetical protein
MKSMRAILIFHVLTVTTALSQSVSPLYQVMTTNSLISRPEVFREMQDSLDFEFGKNMPGLQIEGLHDAFGSIRQRIIDIAVAPTITLNEGSLTIRSDTISTPPRCRWTVSIPLPPFERFDTLWIPVRRDLTDRIAAALDEIRNSVGKSSTSAALIDALATGLSKSDIVAGIDLHPYVDLKGTKKLAAIITAIMIDNIQKKSAQELPLSSIKSKPDVEKMRVFIQKCLTDLSGRIRIRLIGLVNDTENQLSDVVDDISNRLLTANSGVGVTKGQGSFSGGIYLTAWHSTNWQLAAYVNGQLNQGDSTKPAESLVGGHIRYGTDATQCDLLFAALFGDKQFKAWSAGEFGLGLSFRTSGVVVGPALYILGSDVMHPIFTFGATLKSASTGGAGFLLGLQSQNGKLQPIVQSSFPILAR